MHSWHVGAFVLLIIMLAASADVALSAGPAKPSGTCGGSGTVICIDPVTQTIGQNQVTTVDIRIDNVANLYGADVVLSYNKFILCAQDASHPCPNQTSVQLTPGPLLTSGGPGTYFMLLDYANNSNGTIESSINLLNPSQPITGSGVLATITFVGLGGPQSPIHFTYAKLGDQNGFQIPATTQDGVINVSGPTAVSLSSFKLDERRSNRNGITLDWTTASEVSTAGFNIYRSEHEDGPYTRINPQLIPASTDPLAGGSYQYQDSSAVPGRTYYYQLEDIELNGTAVRHTPLPASAPAAADANGNPIAIRALSALGLMLLIGGGWYLLRNRRKAL